MGVQRRIEHERIAMRANHTDARESEPRDVDRLDGGISPRRGRNGEGGQPVVPFGIDRV